VPPEVEALVLVVGALGLVVGVLGVLLTGEAVELLVELAVDFEVELGGFAVVV
jgi:hypothetical protein